jgi:2-keto-4-pentenoate hydratase
MRRIVSLLVVITTAAWLAGCATTRPEPPGCPTAEDTAASVQRFVALQPFPNPPATLTMAAAECGAAKFTQALAASQGRVVGYKAGLTNPVVQQRFGVSEPLPGVLFERMMLKDGAELPAAYGARPTFESDLLVEVASSAIHDAKTPQEVLASLRSVIPFIELADLVVQDPTQITGPAIRLINVGARYGVVGTPIPVRTDPAFAEALREMQVTIQFEGASSPHQSAKGSAILGHPLNAVVWLAAELKRQGITLKPGDLLSLGAFGSGMPAPGRVVRVTYSGLAGNPVLTVRFK